MRSFLSVISIVLFLIMGQSCDHPTKLKMKSFVESYVNYGDISVSQIDLQCLVLTTDDAHNYIYQFSKDKTIKQRYLDLSKKYNDLGYNKTVTGIGLELCRVITPDISKISITSLSAFNSNHAENSSLNDIVKLMSFSLHPYISSSYTHAYNYNKETRSLAFKKYCEQYFSRLWSYPEFGYGSGFVPYYPVESYLNKLKPGDIMMIPFWDRASNSLSRVIGYLYFEELPDVPGDYDIKVEITDENGKVYTSTLTMKFDF